MAKFFDGEEGAAKVIILANVFLIGSKLAVALLTGSLAVIAVLIDSLFDMVGGIFAYFGIRKANEPPDANHFYGHRKFGSLTSLAQLSLIFITAVLIAFEASKRVIVPVRLEITSLDLALIAVVIVIDLVLASYLRKKAKEYSSTALEASAGNYTSDIYQNAMVLVALLGASVGIEFLDPLAAIVVAILMMRVVFKVGNKSVLELTDAGPSRETLAQMEALIRGHKNVRSFHKLRARAVAGGIFADFHIQLNPNLSLKKAHAVAEELKHEIMEKLPDVKEVLIHEEPAESKAVANGWKQIGKGQAKKMTKEKFLKAMKKW